MNSWTYKGYTCWIEEEVEEEECIKNWHYVITPDKRQICAPLSPYVGKEAMIAWIDAGCPQHPTGGNFFFIDGKLEA